jgi:hypothetical protein
MGRSADTVPPTPAQIDDAYFEREIGAAGGLASLEAEKEADGAQQATRSVEERQDPAKINAARPFRKWRTNWRRAFARHEEGEEKVTTCRRR